MKKRKWAALVLSVAMILTMLPTTVFAKETKAEAWDGKSEDTSWYAADKNTYEISNASQLAGLSKLVGGRNKLQEGKQFHLQMILI